MDDNKDTKDQSTVTPNVDNNGEKGGKLFNQDEVNKIIAERLTKEEAKTEQKIKDIIAKERSEAERLAKLSAEDKQKEEQAKKEAQMSEREKKLALREMSIEAKTIMTSKELPVELANFILDADADKTKTNIETLDKVFKKAVADAVTEKLKGNVPPDFSRSNDNTGKKVIPSAF